jgi:acyl-CoA reductase-like NAD-dependent aldehyde dehydrogenase
MESLIERESSIKCLVGGELVAGHGTAFNVTAPSDGQLVATVRSASAEQVDTAVDTAREALSRWRSRPLAERCENVRHAAAALTNVAEDIAIAISAEMGKPIAMAREDVSTVITFAQIACDDALRLYGHTGRSWNTATPSRRTVTTFDPVGVAALISPWNFPIEMLIHASSALVMGNTVVWKPSELAPSGPALAAAAFASALPAGCLNTVIGGAEVGAQLVNHDAVDLVAFVGSTTVGEDICRHAGLKRLILELGGNGPLIVAEDADLDAAAAAASLGCFYNSGQLCVASERILVQAAVKDEFARKLCELADALVVGDPLAPETDIGPLSSAGLVAKVHRHVTDAVDRGAKVLTGGRIVEPQWYQPTVLTGITPEMLIAREETFGPVAPIIEFDQLDDAVQIANDSPYGLQAALFTSSLSTAWDIGEQLEAGAVLINSSTADGEPYTPFGGVKKSGIGRVGGLEGLKSFANIKVLSFTTRP